MYPPIQARRPDLIIINKNKTCQIADFAALVNNRDKVKEYEKNWTNMQNELKK